MPLVNPNAHCDNWVDDPDKPSCVRWWVFLNRLPAVLQVLAKDNIKPWPVLYARHNGVQVRVVMASRFGDVGISSDLKKEHGYTMRVSLSELTEFTNKL